MMDLRHRQRISLASFFFLSGFCFASWASRIPTIKSTFEFNDAQLGTILLFMPVSSLLGLPVSGWLISRFDSRYPLVAGFASMCIALACIGFATSSVALVGAICFFAFATRIQNIAVNTQAITLQKQFEKKINGAFHGLWSTGGIAGVGFSTLMVAMEVDIRLHLLIVSAIAIFVMLFFFRNLLRGDRAKSGNKLQLGKPDPYIIYLGCLVFLAAVCEGGMFDWSGIYFREVVNVDVFTVGYLTFMIFMAGSRFLSDRVIDAIGMRNTYLVSSGLVITGILIAVIFPSFWTAMIGFCLVGLGTAPVIPMTYLLAGGSRKYSPGMAISIIATYGIVGMLVGPPLIGYLSHASSLRLAFIAFAIGGALIIPISRLFFAHRQRMEQQA